MRRSTSKFKFALLGLSLFLVGRLAGAETTNRGVLSVQDVEIGAAGEFSVSSATVSGASCQGQMTNHHSGLVEFAASSCSGSFSSRVNQKRSGLKMGSFRLIRSFLDETYFDVFSTAAICPSSSQTYNYLLARARTPDAGLDFSSSSAFAAGVVTYDPTSGSLTGNQRWSLENTADPTAFTYNKRSASCSNGKLVVTKTSESPSVFDTSAIAYFTSNYGFWKSSTGNYQAGVLMPQQSLDAQVLSSKKSQAYAGMYTHYYKKWLETRKFIYAAPNNAAGTEFKIYEASDPADFSQATEFGVLNCSELNAPAPGFCRGTFSRAGISGTGKALCLFGDNFSGQDVWFCEAQTPDSNSSYHLKTLSTFQFQTTSRAKLAVISPEFVNLEANESSRQITVTVTNPSSRPATIAPASVAPSDVQMPSSFSGAQTTFFQNGSQCGTVLAPFSSCQFTINFNPSEQKVVADYLRVSYDKGDGTGAVNATAVFQAAKGLTGISLNAPSSVTLGESMAVTTTATFSNGQTQDISQLVNKSVSDRAIASVSNTQNAVTVTGTIAGATTVSSTFGSFSAQKEVTVVNPPVAPLNFTATATNGTTIQLSWTAGALNQKHQIAYAIGSVPANCSANTVISSSLLSTSNSYLLSDLTEGSEYSFRVCSVNDAGTFSTSLTASTNTPFSGSVLVVYGNVAWGTTLDGAGINYCNSTLCSPSQFSNEANPVVLINNVKYSSITIYDKGVVRIDPSFVGTIGNITVHSGGVLTGPGFSSGLSTEREWRLNNASPVTGNGTLVLNVRGTLDVKVGGTVTMSGRGYPGGGSGPGSSGSLAHGYSPQGYGVGGAGKSENNRACYYRWIPGGGGSYGSRAPSWASSWATSSPSGEVYGESDFLQKLYLGSGGGGSACWHHGGFGGGALVINARKIINAGFIESNGDRRSYWGGGGSGGSLKIEAQESIANSGTISAAGGGFSQIPFTMTQSSIAWHCNTQNTDTSLMDFSFSSGVGTGNQPNAAVNADLGAEYTVQRVRLGANNCYGEWTNHVNGAHLQYSQDNVNWTTFVTISGVVHNIYQDYFPNIRARYWRVFRPQWGYVILGEFSIHSTDHPGSRNLGGNGRLYLAAPSLVNNGVIVGVRMESEVFPTVSGQPQNVSATPAGVATFSVASPCFNCAITWEKSVDNGSTWSTLLGQNTPILRLATLLASDNGSRYRARIANANSFAYSNPATLTFPQIPVITGGERTVDSNGIITHTFRSSGTLTVTSPGEIEVLVVGGGGSGGTRLGAGGGGGGGVLYNERYSVSTSQTVTVGAGGSNPGIGGLYVGNNGANSSLGALVAIGGGGGGTACQWGCDPWGRAGGSGGGAGRQDHNAISGGYGIPGQGFTGGGLWHAGGPSAGGGGAGGLGGNTISGVQSGAGGPGALYFGSYYGAGGGGGGYGGAAGLGGDGMGGTDAAPNATSGSPNTGAGGGGGGGRNVFGEAGNGGSGIVIIRYKSYAGAP